MEAYELAPKPFFQDSDPAVSLFQGISLSRDSLPVTVQRHDFAPISIKRTSDSISKVLNAALAQAKASHPGICEILEIQVEIDSGHCSVFQVLETLDGNVGRDLEARKRANQPYGEEELRNLLGQAAVALAYMHSKAKST